MVKQAKLRQVHREPIYKFGVQVPRNSKEARYLEQKEGHTHWTKAKTTELDQLHDYNAFVDLGKSTATPTGFTHIKCRFVYT